MWWGEGGAGREHYTCIISFVSHVGMTLATLHALTSFWPYAQSSHLKFIGVGGGEGRGEYSTYIISFFLHVGMILATIQAPTSVWPCSRSSHLEFIGVGGRGGNLIYQHHKPCFTHWHGAGSYFFLALCPQQPVRVCWGGGRGAGRVNTS